MSTAIHGEVRVTAIYVHRNPENVHGEVRVTAIYVHSNPEKCPRRGPKNSNLYNNPEKIIHGVDPDDERSKHQMRCVEMMYRINWKIRQKQQQKSVRKSSNTVKKKKRGMRWAGCEQI